MTIIHFVRHGETVWHAGNRYAGVSDVALTELGRTHARHLADWAERAAPDRILSSTLTRAIETARPAAERLGLELHSDDRLCEVDFGRGEGLTAAEMDAAFPAARRAFVAAPASVPLPGGESGLAALERATPVILDLVHSEVSSVIVVAHSTLTRLLVCWAIGIDPNHYRRLLPRLDNGAVTTIRSPSAEQGDRGTWSLLGVNVPY